MPDATSRLMLLDSASLYFRAFYGLPDSLAAPDGTVINALRGMLDFVATLVTTHRPTQVIACWDDDWRPQWRVDLLESYKAHRVADVAMDAEDVPDLLSPQVPLIAEALGFLGIAVVGAAEAEADDVIGTLAARANCPTDIITGDRDLFQLVDDAQSVRVLYTARGIGKLESVDAAWVRAKYGIEPQQYVDFAVMRGDPSDGLPGVAGIGEKTAAQLLADYGDLDGIQGAAANAASQLRPRIRQSLIDSAEYIAAARTVVRVRPDLPIPEVQFAPVDREALESFAARWGVVGAATRAAEALFSQPRP